MSSYKPSAGDWRQPAHPIHDFTLLAPIFLASFFVLANRQDYPVVWMRGRDTFVSIRSGWPLTSYDWIHGAYPYPFAFVLNVITAILVVLLATISFEGWLRLRDARRRRTVTMFAVSLVSAICCVIAVADYPRILYVASALYGAAMASLYLFFFPWMIVAAFREVLPQGIGEWRVQFSIRFLLLLTVLFALIFGGFLFVYSSKEKENRTQPPVSKNSFCLGIHLLLFFVSSWY